MTGDSPTRREFLVSSSLLIGFVLPSPSDARGAKSGVGASFAPNAFVRIDQDDRITIVIKHIEFGQGISTGLATILADELDADWSHIGFAVAPANDALYKNLASGTMSTGGSNAVSNSWMQMRRAGAAARAMLVRAAAERWGVAQADISVSKGSVQAGSRQATFGQLAAAAARLPVPDVVELKKAEHFTLIGKSGHKLDTAEKVDGSAIYTMDIQRPGMVVAVVLHPPAFGATLLEVEAADTLAIAGVIAVRTIPQGVVTYAKDTYSALKGRAALRATWDFGSAETRSSDEMIATYAEAALRPGVEAEARGDLALVSAQATSVIDATYIFPFLAHAPMEPLDSVIHAEDGRVDVWMASQAPVRDMRAIADTLSLPLEAMTHHQLFAGGSFGRRSMPSMSFAVEVANVAKAFGPVPIKLFWTREDDIQGGHYRPLVVHRVRGWLDARGSIAAWEQVIAAQSFFAGTPREAAVIKNGLDPTIVDGAVDGIYKWPAHRIGQHIMQNGVPALWWRSVGNSHTAFVTETFIDELLERAGTDPIEGRLKLIEDTRAAGVLRSVAKMARGLQSGNRSRARGVAVHQSFGTYVAQIAEISEGDDGLPKVHRIWCAVDCGIAINPDVIRAQMESCIGYGLGHAIYAEIEIGEHGRVTQENFDTYRSLRIGEMPLIEIEIVDASADPTGVGEPGLPPVAPAVANAWRRLTGQAVRRLPFAATRRERTRARDFVAEHIR